MSQKRWSLSRKGWCLGAWLLLPSCAASVESGRAGEARLPRAVAQRVTATVQRAAVRLVRLETERESLLTTPEHPFATPGSGWIRAGRLLPGEGLVSERFGAVRLLAVRGELAAQPVPVFNLSVASSHAYFVGADRVLVHNTKCKPSASEAREQEIERVTRERAEINREIKALTQTTPESPQIAALKRQREKYRYRLKYLREVRRKEQGTPAPNQEGRALQSFRADHESARNALEAVQQELAELEGQAPTSDAGTLARQAELKKQRSVLQLGYERTGRILAWLAEIEELDQDTPATDADGRLLEERKEALRTNIRLERKRQSDLKYSRRERADPERRKARDAYGRNQDQRRRRTASYVADTERPRDPLELLEEELSRQLQATPSESRDARISHVTEQIETMKRRVELCRERKLVFQRRFRARGRREQLIAQEKDTREIDQRLEQTERESRAIRVEIAQLRVRERLLVRLDGTPWADAPGSVDEARLREFERQLAEGLEDEQALAGIERALDAMEPPHDGEAALAEADEVDALLSEREELMGQGASPERAVGLESSYERLEQELREERVAVEGAVSALVNESAHLQTTQASSSSGANWQERLRGIQEEQGRLLAHWRADLQTRVESARGQLHLLRSIERFRDEEVETELVREIALLERELKRAGG